MARGKHERHVGCPAATGRAYAWSGDGISRTEAGEDWPFPAAAFAGRGVIAGREVRCLTPEFEVSTHAGNELDDHDTADVSALVARFGVVPPSGA